MKKIFLASLILHTGIALSFLTSCTTPRKDYATTLGPKQINLLTTPAEGTAVEFDENGVRTTTTVGKLSRDVSLTKEEKGSMFGGGANYTRESGTVYYTIPTTQATKISIEAASADPQTDGYAPYQYIHIGSSTYSIDFKNTLTSRIINGVSYTDVVLGIDQYRNDTLFWKKDVGILGWKRADVSWTAYRVF